MYPKLGIGYLCRLFGKTRHAYYDYLKRRDQSILYNDLVIHYVDEIRSKLPRIGTRKLHHLLTPKLDAHSIKLGRDALFNLLSDNKLLIRQRKRKAITTNSRHWMKKYNNLIIDFQIIRPEQVWVSDITYIRMIHDWSYLSLVTDAYSKKIMGFSLRMDLSTEGCIDALNMALNNRMYQDPLIHHSDRGSQYCSQAYVKILLENKIAISMTQNGDPCENAIAERINGTIKNEFNLHSTQVGFEQTLEKVKNAIVNYNLIRPHLSCNFLTPNEAHLETSPMLRRWKNYNKNFSKERTRSPSL
ncbi:MAG: IS3 family transposase [Saprospiraceae bacterium]|nr:IS3 family transposase [Saprospiraceae bacterium]